MLDPPAALFLSLTRYVCLLDEDEPAAITVGTHRLMRDQPPHWISHSSDIDNPYFNFEEALQASIANDLAANRGSFGLGGPLSTSPLSMPSFCQGPAPRSLRPTPSLAMPPAAFNTAPQASSPKKCPTLCLNPFREGGNRMKRDAAMQIERKSERLKSLLSPANCPKSDHPTK